MFFSEGESPWVFFFYTLLGDCIRLIYLNDHNSIFSKFFPIKLVIISNEIHSYRIIPFILDWMLSRSPFNKKSSIDSNFLGFFFLKENVRPARNTTLRHHNSESQRKFNTLIVNWNDRSWWKSMKSQWIHSSQKHRLVEKQEINSLLKASGRRDGSSKHIY